MKNSRVALIASHYLITDPPTRNVVKSLEKLGYKIVFFQQASSVKYSSDLTKGIIFINIYDFSMFNKIAKMVKLLKWWYYCIRIRAAIRLHSPEIVISIMFHPLAAIPLKNSYTVYCGVLDIPTSNGSGKLDGLIIKRALNKLKQIQIVWASDILKAEIVKRIAKLEDLPFVINNCPGLEEYKEKILPRDTWLRSELIKSGAPISTDTGLILIRAGAIGRFCGIEETLQAMTRLPESFVFLMMGRPEREYEMFIKDIICKKKLEKRAFLWVQPTDEIWKKALHGADWGHLIHISPIDNLHMENVFSLNSSLSNNRLYQYLAAGLPILTYNDPRMDIIYKKIDCFLVADTTDLENEIIRTWQIIENIDRRKSYANNAREAFEKEYNWEFQFESIRKVISGENV
ncbi:MAG: glycosyltransferase [Chitinophagaceae bacterium]|nr:glycosyltransferase [Chitinophagaceae bacterium]